jgi:hypothetical protein
MIEVTAIQFLSLFAENPIWPQNNSWGRNQQASFVGMNYEDGRVWYKNQFLFDGPALRWRRAGPS